MSKLPIPIDAILEDRLAIVGTAGSGKTYAAGVLTESVLADGHRAIIVDPLGVWYGLRLRQDGVTPSRFNPVIFGGKHGDLSLTEHGGQVIGEAVAGMAQSCVLDLSQFGTTASERRFMLAFLTALYRNTTNSPVHIIFDEADMWAPQKIFDKDGESAKLLGMMETLVRRGRVKGFIPWLITQRPAVVSKNVLSQADGIIAMKLTSSQDRDAIGAWVEGQADKGQWKALYGSLAEMQRGHGIIWIPGRGIMEEGTFPAKATFDSSRTPKRGETVAAVELKPIDIGVLKERLSRVEAETKANDPKTLRAEIAALKRQLITVTPSAKVDTREIEETAEQRGRERALKAVAGLAMDMVKSLEGVEQSVASTRRLLDSFGGFIASQASHLREYKTAPRPVPISQPRERVFTRNGIGAISPSARAILDVIHKSYPRGLSFDTAARHAVISKRSSAYRKYRAEVLESGEVEGNETRLVSLPEFAQSAPLPPGAAVDEWARRLPPSFGSMLRAIAQGHDTKGAIADASGVSLTSSGLGSGLRELIALELVTQDGDRYLLAEDM